MTKTVTRLFTSHAEAMTAVSDLEAAGVEQNDISLVASNGDNWHAGHEHASADIDENEAAEGAGKGATTGGVIGGAGGLLAGLGMLAIPGLGPVVAAGWLISTAVGAAAGAAVGGATGGILGALKDAGHSDEDAQVYAEGVRRGGSLVSVRAHDDRAAEVEAILQRRQGVDAAARGAAYRETGWTGFNTDAPAYSADEITRERSRYAAGEARSFGDREAGADADVVDGGGQPLSTPPAPGLGRGV